MVERPERSDAIVFFGATRDLAYRQIFPALVALAARGHLDVPVIGVARPGWDRDRLVERARDSLVQHAELNKTSLDSDAFDTLAGLLRYVGGDYTDPATFEQLRHELAGAKRPLHYLAIPPALFGAVVEALGASGCARGARVGRDDVVESSRTRDHRQQERPPS
ncbi:MAG: hypothetical protein ABIP03_13015 [Aquihabitans sp.]